MAIPDPYNEEVRARFENPVHAGDVAGDYAEVVVAEVAESHHGARLVLYAGVNDGKIAALRFRVRGCPHLVAAADAVCEGLEGQSAGRLADVSASELMARLAVPTSKTGRILLIEDAARVLLESMGESAPGN